MCPPTPPPPPFPPMWGRNPSVTSASEPHPQFLFVTSPLSQTAEPVRPSTVVRRSFFFPSHTFRQPATLTCSPRNLKSSRGRAEPAQVSRPRQMAPPQGWAWNRPASAALSIPLLFMSDFLPSSLHPSRPQPFYSSLFTPPFISCSVCTSNPAARTSGQKPRWGRH